VRRLTLFAFCYLLVGCNLTTQTYCDSKGCFPLTPIQGLQLEFDNDNLSLVPDERSTVRVRLSSSGNFGTLPPKDDYTLEVTPGYNLSATTPETTLDRDEAAVPITLSVSSFAKPGTYIVFVSVFKRNVGYVRDAILVTVKESQ
jgi:hypothetical protein